MSDTIMPTPPSTPLPTTKICIIPEQNKGTPWFEDGNVILMTRDRAFKVYKGMLAQHSALFNDILEKEVQEIVGGCPAVHLDDSTTDLANFLAVIHGCEKTFQFTSKQEFVRLVGVLRIATKYKADALRQRALLPLQRIYPSKLSQWDEMFESHSLLWLLDPVTVTNIAREVSALSLIPAAMAFLANGTLAQEAFGVAVCQSWPLRFSPGLLSTEDLKAFAMMKEYNHGSIARTLRFVREHGKNRHASCQRLHTSEGCSAKFNAMFVSLAVVAATSEAPAGYSSFVVTVQGLLQREDICGSCRDSFDVGLERRRMAWWRGLPQAVGFSGWDDKRLK